MIIPIGASEAVAVVTVNPSVRVPRNYSALVRGNQKQGHTMNPSHDNGMLECCAESVNETTRIESTDHRSH